jgi:hypothetical protein
LKFISFLEFLILRDEKWLSFANGFGYKVAAVACGKCGEGKRGGNTGKVIVSCG